MKSLMYMYIVYSLILFILKRFYKFKNNDFVGTYNIR